MTGRESLSTSFDETVALNAHLTQLTGEVHRRRTALRTAVAKRNTAIRRAIEAGYSGRWIALVTGLQASTVSRVGRGLVDH